jgi:alkyldihydroxyacetonephosphate synthase
MTERKRSFYGWGYEDYQLPPGELAWFERAWCSLFKVDRFEPAAMPRAEEITLRAPRVAAPTSLAAICTTGKHERLFHSFGRSVHDLARMIHRRDFSNPPDVVAYPKTERDIPVCSTGAAQTISPRSPSAAARALSAA